VKNTDRMHTYQCDGMPTMAGCSSETTISVPYVREGRKKSGWLVTHATEDLEGTPTIPIHLLFFCPSCADIVEEQDAEREKRKPLNRRTT
jgi:hypothetical protein